MYNSSGTATSVYVTAGVGALGELHPLDVVCRPLVLVGVPEIAMGMYRAADRVHLHPALVAAAAQATLELAARAVGETPPARDARLFARLQGGRGALGTGQVGYIDLARDLLVRVSGYGLQLGGGTRFNGVVRWNSASPVIQDPPSEFDVQEEATRAVRGMTLIAHASPPIISLQRAPSLEFFRHSGSLQLRNFGPFEIEGAP